MHTLIKKYFWYCITSNGYKLNSIILYSWIYFSFFTITNNIGMNFLIYISWYMYQNFWNCWAEAVLSSRYSNLHSHQLCLRIFVSPHLIHWQETQWEHSQESKASNFLPLSWLFLAPFSTTRYMTKCATYHRSPQGPLLPLCSWLLSSRKYDEE